MNDLWRHKKRGTFYVHLGVAKLQTTNPIQEGEELVVYRDEDGKLWARPQSEFNDGRFEHISVYNMSISKGI